MAHDDSGSVTPRFEPGAKVRVKYGITASAFEDIPLGGWAGSIEMIEVVDDQVDYEVKWDRRTLDAMHPVYRKRCERDDLGLETMWLTEEDLEADDETPVPIEQPTKIVTPPLSEKDQDDRVRKALGLTHDDPLPDVTEETLLAYHRYLAAHLNFPLHFTSWEKAGPFASKKVTVVINGLADPNDGGIDEGHGLIGSGRHPSGEEMEFPLDEIEVKKKDPNARLLSDYSFWFHNWR